MKFGVVLLFVFVLSSCAVITQTVPTEEVNQTWQARTTYLNENKAWTVHMSLSGKTSQKKFSVRLVWGQQADHYQIKLRDFIGRTVAVIDGWPDKVVVNTSKGKKYESNDAESLLLELFDMHIPLKGLSYWLRALPKPESATQALVFNAQGLPENIQQEGWEMSYLDYQSYDACKMPKQMLLSYNDLELSLTLNRWTFAP